MTLTGVNKSPCTTCALFCGSLGPSIVSRIRPQIVCWASWHLPSCSGKAAYSQAPVFKHCQHSSENSFPSEFQSRSMSSGYPGDPCEHNVPGWPSPPVCLTGLWDGYSVSPYTTLHPPHTLQDRSNALGSSQEPCQPSVSMAKCLLWFVQCPGTKLCQSSSKASSFHQIWITVELEEFLENNTFSFFIHLVLISNS